MKKMNGMNMKQMPSFLVKYVLVALVFCTLTWNFAFGSCEILKGNQFRNITHHSKDGLQKAIAAVDLEAAQSVVIDGIEKKWQRVELNKLNWEHDYQGNIVLVAGIQTRGTAFQAMGVLREIPRRIEISNGSSIEIESLSHTLRLYVLDSKKVVFTPNDLKPFLYDEVEFTSSNRDLLLSILVERFDATAQANYTFCTPLEFNKLVRNMNIVGVYTTEKKIIQFTGEIIDVDSNGIKVLVEERSWRSSLKKWFEVSIPFTDLHRVSKYIGYYHTQRVIF